MQTHPYLLIVDKNRQTFDVPRFEGTGMKGGEYFRLTGSDLIKLPPDSELFMLPDRSPVGYDSGKKTFNVLRHSPLTQHNDTCYAVAAFLPPGYTVTYSAAYSESRSAQLLPLFSYAPVVFYRNALYTTAVRVDRERRQTLKGVLRPALLRKNVKSFRGIFPRNRLVRHLETCALVYGCPAARNFFLKRYEAPLPTSPGCNAACIGCISHQPKKKCSVTQPRIRFVPTPEEVADIALFHIKEVRSPVVSFGQGCEGEPLLEAEVLERAVKLIRKSTSKGMININTNASRPDVVRRLFAAGMNSMRVSMNSVRETCYSAYYKPRGYTFRDVTRSIREAKKAGGFVSINYLVMPGFTDALRETKALSGFLKKTGVDMIQWRNLNYDPLAYFKRLKISVKREDMTGIAALIRNVKKTNPRLMHGYFNPSRERIRRAQ